MGGYDRIIQGLGLGCTASIFGAAFIGAAMPINSVFAWHTVLMTLGFSFFMSLGRRAYRAELPEAMDTSKQGRRMLHIGLMVAAFVCVCLGFAAIITAHYPGKQFFGYDFTKQEWKPLMRMVHVYLGYAAIAMVLFQVVIGALKKQALVEGLAKYGIHERAGVHAHHVGLMAICAGAYIMPWNAGLRAAAGACAVGIVGLMHKASLEEAKGEAQGILKV